MQTRGHRSVATCADMEKAHKLVCESMQNEHVVMLLGAGSIAKLALQLRAEWVQA